MPIWSVSSLAMVSRRCGDARRAFPPVVLIILEQQVSLASARAAFDRLQAALGDVEPAAFLSLDDAQLGAIGFSAQKAGYCRGLAAGVLDGSIDLDHIGLLDDDEARRRLVAIRGIGPWTADVYLMFALGRIDAWPPGDRALLVSLGRAKAPRPRPHLTSPASRWLRRGVPGDRWPPACCGTTTWVGQTPSLHDDGLMPRWGMVGAGDHLNARSVALRILGSLLRRP